jgi:hypothetical protein
MLRARTVAACAAAEDYRGMIKVIRYSLFSGFYYWEKPVMNRLGRHRQNDYFMVVIRPQYCIPLTPEIYDHWFQGENNRSVPDHHTPEIIQIPIASRHTDRLCHHPAVSSLGACPTPAL